jgi:RNA recognition motif-containing protein
VSNKLFVGGLSWNTTDQDLQEAFGTFGEVTEAKVVTDRETGRSRGFGFVTFASEEDAANARREMDGATLDSRKIRVDAATPRGSGGGGGGGGRFDRGGGGGGGGRGREGGGREGGGGGGRSWDDRPGRDRGHRRRDDR